jgi:putative membrane protein
VSSLLLARFIYIYPFSPAFDWAQASDSFFQIILVASIAIFAHMTITWSFKLALLLFVISGFVSSVAEILGLTTGLPFGTLYRYHPDIQTRITEELPLAIPLAWFIVCCLPLILLRPWLLHADPASGSGNEESLPRALIARQVVISSLVLTACDLFLEPLSVYTGYWTWIQQGHYFGAPVTNFLGWFCVGLIIFSLFFYIKNRWFRHAANASSHLDHPLIGLVLFWIIVALTLIGYKLDNLVPVWLTALILGPFLYLRVCKERQIRAAITPAEDKRDGPG